MSTIVSWNGSNFTVPAVGEQNWGGATKVDGLLASLATNGFQKTGGLFSLSADVDWGPTAGHVAIYYKSRGSNIATTGIIRLASTDVIAWRNNAHGADLPMTTDASDNLLYNGHIIVPSTGIIGVAAGGTGIGSYTSGDMLYASGVTTLSQLAISGSTSKVLTSNGSVPSWNTIVNANVDAAAAIAYSKLAALTSGNILVGSAGNVATSVTMSGDVTNDNAGATTIGTKKVTAAKMSSGVASSGTVATADGAGGVSYSTVPSSPDSCAFYENGSLAASVATNALTIALKDKSGSDASGGSQVQIGFRNATSATGTYNFRSVTAALSITIPASTTIGQISAQAEYIYVYAIDNAGTVELAVSSLNLFDEGSILTTTAVSGGSSRSTIYSTTARTGVPIRLIGRIKSTQATAGTWASAVTEISNLPLPQPITYRSEVIVKTGNGHGGTNNKIRRFTTTESSVGTAITYADSAANGGSFTINEEGLYGIHYSDERAAGATFFGVSKNSAELTTDVSTLTTDSTRMGFGVAPTNLTNSMSVQIRCSPGDVLRAHTDGASDGSTTRVRFKIIKLSA